MTNEQTQERLESMNAHLKFMAAVAALPRIDPNYDEYLEGGSGSAYTYTEFELAIQRAHLKAANARDLAFRRWIIGSDPVCNSHEQRQFERRTARIADALLKRLHKLTAS